ncbi:MAG: VanZ family protein [Thermoanaerobaculia bacterium]|nr:VanZ family protein [Thermoanaerobaculia bacterium]
MLTPTSRRWILLPLGLMVLIQIVSGLPAPADVVSKAISGPLRESLVDWVGGESELRPFVRNLFNGLHLPVFGVLALVWAWAATPWTPRRRVRYAATASLCIAFGVLNEISQKAVPTRWASVDDALADALGVVLGTLLYVVLDSTVRRSSKREAPVRG